MLDTCKHHRACPVYSGNLRDISMTPNAFRQLYCDNGIGGWGRCKRFQVDAKIGKVPERLLPNSLKTVAEIIRQYNLA